MGAKAFLSVFNHRVLFVVVETLLIYFLYDAYDIHLETDFTIISIAIVFPLVFSITSAYQRRQDAVELFINFRNKIIDLTNILFAVNDFKKEDYNRLLHALIGLQNNFITYLKTDTQKADFDQIRQQRKDLFQKIIAFKTLYNEREKDSIIRVKNELFLSIEKLNGIKIHGTQISLRKYCLIFIYFSPLLFNSQIIVTSVEIGLNPTSFMSLFFAVLISFVLMALYNVQEYIENPFDQKGLDDLKIDQLAVENSEGIYD
jgi:predicted membrane chloride channel (bestrophin family)